MSLLFVTERDGPVSNDDCVEVFIAPDPEQVKSYFNFEINCGGTMLLYYIPDSAFIDGRFVKYMPVADFLMKRVKPGGGKGDRFAFFAVPYDMKTPDVRIVAVDAAENEAELRFIDKFFPKKFKEDTVDLTDAFLGKVFRCRSQNCKFPK